jgi:hypothetical protein
MERLGGFEESPTNSGQLAEIRRVHSHEYLQVDEIVSPFVPDCMLWCLAGVQRLGDLVLDREDGTELHSGKWFHAVGAAPLPFNCYAEVGITTGA